MKFSPIFQGVSHFTENNQVFYIDILKLCLAAWGISMAEHYQTILHLSPSIIACALSTSTLSFPTNYHTYQALSRAL